MERELTIGFAFTGSYCTFSKILPSVKTLVGGGIRVLPIFSERSAITDTRFGKADEFIKKIEEITDKKQYALSKTPNQSGRRS